MVELTTVMDNTLTEQDHSAKVMHMLHDLDLEVNQIGTTVRNGLKWRVDKGTELLLCVCTDRCLTSICNEAWSEDVCGNCHRVGRGQVLSTWTGKFRDIPARLIENEHEIRSRLYSGLYDSMEKAYGDSFRGGATVTVVEYVRTA